MDSIDNFSSEIYEYEEDDEILDATKTQMVLGSLEKSLVNLIIKEIHNFDKNSGLTNKAYIAFTTTYRREPKDNIELIRKSNLSMLPGIARQILADSSLSKYLIRLEDLMNALQIYTSRSQSYAHPGNEYSPVHWARVQALALDPVMHQLGFIPVIERYYAAKKGELERIDLSDAYLNEIPNNLPNPDCEQLIGNSTKSLRFSM